MPISRVRSVTETSMMFMMPTPPTTSEMAAMPASMAVRGSDDGGQSTFAISAMLRTSKSAFSPGGMRWRSVSNVRISCSARADRPSLRAETKHQIDVGERRVLQTVCAPSCRA